MQKTDNIIHIPEPAGLHDLFAGAYLVKNKRTTALIARNVEDAIIARGGALFDDGTSPSQKMGGFIDEHRA